MQENPLYSIGAEILNMARSDPAFQVKNAQNRLVFRPTFFVDGQTLYVGIVPDQTDFSQIELYLAQTTIDAIIVPQKLLIPSGSRIVSLHYRTIRDGEYWMPAVLAIDYLKVGLKNIQNSIDSWNSTEHPLGQSISEDLITKRSEVLARIETLDKLPIDFQIPCNLVDGPDDELHLAIVRSKQSMS